MLDVTYLTTLFSNEDKQRRIKKKRVVSELWIGNDLEGSCLGIILKYYPGIRLERLRKSKKTSDRIASL
jgi:hypothetical protein